MKNDALENNKADAVCSSLAVATRYARNSFTRVPT